MTDIKFNKWGSPEVDQLTMATSIPGIFCGGDLAGTAETAVEAVADGKIAAWSIHRYLQVGGSRPSLKRITSGLSCSTFKLIFDVELAQARA